MKEELTTKKIIPARSNGFSTIDALMALAVLSMAFMSIIPLTLGEQTLSVDSETNHAALLLAKKNIETASAQLRANFDASPSVNPSDPEYDNGFYIPDLDSTYISPCSRNIKSSIDWPNESRYQSSEIMTMISSPIEVFCDPLPPSSDWDTPQTYESLSPGDFDGQGTGLDLSYKNGIRYVFLTTDASGPAQDNFYVIDTSDPENTSGSDIIGIKVGEFGLNGLVVSGNYAYVLNNNTTDYIDHLMVVDITNPLDPKHLTGSSQTLPDITNGVARSIYYYNQKLYIGTQYVPSGINHEFHIYNVSSPANPSWEASIDVDRNVNAITVSNGFAYLATGPGASGTNNPLKIYSTETLSQVGSFTASETSDQAGTSLYLLGSKLYLGLEKATGSNKDFYILNVSDQTTPVKFSDNSAVKLDLPGSNALVSAIVVQGSFAFLGATGTNSQQTFHVWNIVDTDNLYKINICMEGDPLPQDLTDLMYADNLIFASFRSNTSLQIIYDSADICS